MVNWFPLTKDAERKVPLKVTADEPINPLPLIVSVKGPDPADADEGDKPEMIGDGFWDIDIDPSEITTFDWVDTPSTVAVSG